MSSIMSMRCRGQIAFAKSVGKPGALFLKLQVQSSQCPVTRLTGDQVYDVHTVAIRGCPGRCRHAAKPKPTSATCCEF